ncbi:MAG: hypothetical protein ABIO67_08070 [Mycobacteriales bacterium]
MTAQESPLGRYAGEAGGQAYAVRLLNLPVRLVASSRERHDELLREFSLLALSDDPRRGDLPARLLELIEVLGVQYATAKARPDTIVDEAIAAGLHAVDVTYVVPASVVEAADRLEHLMAQSDEFCASERLLTLPRTQTQRDLANWYFGEFRRQVAGEDPQPWDGPSEI